VARQQVYVPTTVGGGCFLGGSVVEAADTVTVERGYGECAQEVQALVPEYQARSVCTDGWEATRQAWRRLFPQITLVLCFLHSVLKIKDRCTGQLRHQVLDRVWQVYQAATKRQFAQRLRRLAEWTPTHLRGAVAEMVLKMCRRRADFIPAYDCPQAHRPSNAVDRLLTYQDRLLYAMRYCHGTTDSARLAVSIRKSYPLRQFHLAVDQITADLDHTVFYAKKIGKSSFDTHRRCSSCDICRSLLPNGDPSGA
jgi:hypothetical protein